MRILTITAGIAMASAFAGVAHADFVKTVESEAQCIEQEGTVMDLQSVKHCLVPVIPEDFQTVEYAGEIKGVTECAAKQTRKTQIGDFCLIALEAKPAKAEKAIAMDVEPAANEPAPNGGVITTEQASDLSETVIKAATPKND